MSEIELTMYQTLKLDFGTDKFLSIIYKILSRPQSRAIFMFRLSSSLFYKGKIGWFFSMVFWQLNIMLHSCEIVPNAKIGTGLMIIHTSGIVIGHATIGKNFAIYQNTTIGAKKLGYEASRPEANPVIGDDVILYAGAVIAGPIKIGNRAHIGANTVTIVDVPENHIVIPVQNEMKCR